MIVKGIVESFENRNNIKVRVPFLNGASSQADSTPTSDLPNAVLCQLPNLDLQLAIGDIVWLGFENAHWDKPVILGFLDIAQQSKISPVADSITINQNAILPHETTIGQVSANSIACLTGVTENIADYMANNTGVYTLDLTGYSDGDYIPESVLWLIPENAYIIAKIQSNAGTYRYYNLLEKTIISNSDESDGTIPTQYNYIFANAYGLLKIESQIVSITNA